MKTGRIEMKTKISLGHEKFTCIVDSKVQGTTDGMMTFSKKRGDSVGSQFQRGIKVPCKAIEKFNF
jgi:hypothetical protein